MSIPWRRSKPENHRLVFILLAGLAVVPSLVIMIVDGRDSNLLPMIAVFSIGYAALLALIQWFKMRKQQVVGQVHDEDVAWTTARKTWVVLAVIVLVYLAWGLILWALS